ncbi:putative DNA primase/helicase [Nitrosomonas sp. PY1]|uniref:DUF3631 domain-containing protein n=1 Tax=Nitrosomonas sp. PY1 TaxID=1803906 RepID=UPI001FC7DB3C|nr:DUF3631 domain-containing protein [Nitrosomonas sp. PY1]GKS70222.1 putative DNA primase/helicase [Nitrosomonas sp. PY1]
MTFETIPANHEQQTVYADLSTETLQDTIARLAKLHPLEYDKVRQDEADKLGLSRVAELDKSVKQARKQSVEDNAPFANIEPYAEPVNPLQLLNEISATIRQFIVLEKYQADIAALWVAVCWSTDDIQTAPILLINAPERACGKTQLLTLLAKLAPRATQLSGISPSVLFRMIEKYQPTLFIDEVETVLKDNEDLRGLLNAGHTRDSAFVWRSVAAGDDFEPKRFNVWGMKAIAGINAIKLAETVTSRSIVFELRRKKPNEKVDRLRFAEPLLFERLTAQLARFSKDYSNQVRETRPVLPDELGDREQDNIEPLLQIAYVAGDHWPDTATNAALKIFQASHSAQSTANELLSDIQEVFETKNVGKMSTADLITALVSDDEKSWQTYNRGKPLSPKQLANKLKSFGINSRTIRIGFETPRGYELNQFSDVFERYLTHNTHSPFLSATLPQSSIHKALLVADDVADKNPKCNSETNVLDRKNVAHSENLSATRKPAPALDCDNVADRTPPAVNCVRI